MNGIAQLRIFVAAIAAVTLSACGGNGGSSFTPQGKGELTISLTDGPVDEVTEVNVEITGMQIKPVGGPAFDLVLTQTPYVVDLLSLTDDNAAVLVDGAVINEGDYEWLRMDMNAEIDTVFDSYVVEKNGGAWVEIFVPSGTVRLVNGFSVEANEALELKFDWDMRKGLVKPPGLGGYILKPAFRVIGTTPFGTLSGAIPVSTVTSLANDCNADSPVANDYDVGNTVYVFEGFDAEVDDIDGADNDPVATADAAINLAATDYEYSILLPFGEYTVAFTCQSANDLPESSEAGNEVAATNTVEFFDPPVNVTIGPPGEINVEQNF